MAFRPDSVAIRSRFGRFGRFRRVASCRFGRFRRVASCRFGRFRRDLRTSSWRFVLIRSIRSCRVAIRRVGSVDSVARPVDFGASRRVGVLLVSRFGRFRRDLRTSSWRFGRFGRFRRVASSWSAACVAISARRVASKSRRKHKKKPDSSIGESGSAIARRRALLTFR